MFNKNKIEHAIKLVEGDPKPERIIEFKVKLPGDKLIMNPYKYDFRIRVYEDGIIIVDRDNIELLYTPYKTVTDLLDKLIELYVLGHERRDKTVAWFEKMEGYDNNSPTAGVAINSRKHTLTFDQMIEIIRLIEEV